MVVMNVHDIADEGLQIKTSSRSTATQNRPTIKGDVVPYAAALSLHVGTYVQCGYKRGGG